MALMRDERKGRLLIRYKACAMSNLSNFAQRFLHAARRLVRQAKAPGLEGDLEPDALESSIKRKVSILVPS